MDGETAQAETPPGKGWSRQARDVFFTADAAARMHRCNYISTEHLLIGLLHKDDSQENVAVRALRAMGVSPDAVRDRLWERMDSRGDAPYQAIELTGNALAVLKLAFREAINEVRGSVRIEDLFVALVQGPGLAGQVLAEFGVEVGRLREALATLRTGVQGDTSGDPSGDTPSES
jgi:ATP-dependent Clp protease ATP-binding subunit ClpC